MPQFSDSTMEKVRSVSIDKIVEPYVELNRKSSSRDLWGCCPFHNENTPSFKVDLEHGFFKCFGCDAKGNGITFIMRKHGLSFSDAVVFIAERFGIPVEYVGENNKKRKDIIALHDDIQVVLRQYLYSSEGSNAREYALSRSFEDDDLNEFGIGYIPPRADFSSIFKNYSEEVLYASGFFKENRFGSPSSRFFDRLTFPIRNITGSIAAFAGRAFEKSAPKYLNSAESEIFHKGETLFNIDKAKNYIKSSAQCVIVEGYFDVMRLHKIGVKNVVAPMGTAFTPNQAGMLKYYADDITVVFDGDEAGEKAAYRSLDIFIGKGIFPKAVFLPRDDDPDTFCLREGIDGWKKIFSNREDLFLNISQRLVKAVNNDFNKKLIRFQSVKKRLMLIEDPHLRDYYSEAVADIFKLKKENIDSDIAEARYRNSSVKEKGKSLKNTTNNTFYPCEMDFIACLARLPIDVVDNLVFDMSEDMFTDNIIQGIFKKILEVYGRISDIRELVNELDDTFVDIISRDITGDAYKTALLNKEQIIKNHLKRRHAAIIERLKNIADNNEKILLIKELDELTRSLAASNIRQGV